MRDSGGLAGEGAFLKVLWDCNLPLLRHVGLGLAGVFCERNG